MVEGVRTYGADATLEEVLDMTTLDAVRWRDREAGRKGSDAPDGKKSEAPMRSTPTSARGCATNHLDLRRRLEPQKSRTGSAQSRRSG